MRRRGCGINVIIEGLVINRQGIITESAEEQVQKEIKSFMSKHNVTGRQKSNFYKILTTVYGMCNTAGPYKIIKGDLEVVGSDGNDDKEAVPEINASLYEFNYDIKFLSAVDVKALYRDIRNTLKEMKNCYKSFNADSFAIIVGFESEDNGLYISIEKGSKSLKIRVGYQEYVVEAKTGLCGTEIGLPIDNEGTDVGGVSAPTGSFSKDSEQQNKKKKKEIFPSIIENEDENSEEERKEQELERDDRAEDEDGVLRVVCPKCKSINVNSDGYVLFCSDCGYTWEVDEDEDEEIIDRMVPQEDDEDASKYSTSDYMNNKNQVECIQTQQNVDKSSLV